MASGAQSEGKKWLVFYKASLSLSGLFVCLFVIYFFEQVKVLVAIKLMSTCYTYPYIHKGQPQDRELHALLFANSVWVLQRPTLNL